MYSWERENLNLDTTEGQVVISRHYHNHGPFTFTELKEWIKDEYWHDEYLCYKIDVANTFLQIREVASDANVCYFIMRMFEDWLIYKCELKKDAERNGY